MGARNKKKKKPSQLWGREQTCSSYRGPTHRKTECTAVDQSRLSSSVFFPLPVHRDVCQFTRFALKPWQNLDKNDIWCKRADIGGIHGVVLNPPLFESHSFPCGCLATPLQHNILWINRVKRDRCLLKTTSQGCSPVIDAFSRRCGDASFGFITVWSSENTCHARTHTQTHARTQRHTTNKLKSKQGRFITVWTRISAAAAAAAGFMSGGR